ncbi:MFS transporter [Caulobacter sp. NIBR2454]|uniref:MFS transporter n=1 Tax=Caulobacter sp. NIBR2454 TaxID=3015996 RepID=UPI0022B73EBC|nr:MFS transporter [Caulobacter sp. NIBR2454]
MTTETPTSWRELMTPDLALRFALLCLGIWLNAADTLVTVTIMPSVGEDMGGYQYFGWAVAAYLLGAIIAGAAAGRISMVLGLRQATVLAGVAYCAGCLASALAPDFLTFVVGRLVQGLGAGAIVALCYVAIAVMFPHRMWGKIFGAISAVWGVATVLGPLVGGLFAQFDFWRGAFWMFAIQGVVFVVACLLLMEKDGKDERATGVPIPQLLVLTVGVVMIASAGIVRSPLLGGGLAVVGVLVMASLLRVNATARTPLLPRSAGDLRRPAGAGYFMIFALEAAAIGLSVYGPAFVQRQHDASPLFAGYVISAIAGGWTVTALLAAVVPQRLDGWMIRAGATCVLLGTVWSAWTLPHRSVAEIFLSLLLVGCGFGLTWGPAAKRIISALPTHEQAMGSSSIPTAQMIGGAAGAAGVGAAANALGFGHGVDPALATTVGSWLFGALIPLSLAGWLAGWRLGGMRD